MPLRLTPRRNQFLVLFRENVATLMEGLETLQAMLAGPVDAFADCAAQLRQLEHAADEVTHRISYELNHTFITPFDRDDIFALATVLDDVIDLAEETADTIVLDGIRMVTPAAQQMSALLVAIGHELVAAVDRLDGNPEGEECWARIHALENQADEVTRDAIGALFTTFDDPIEIIRWKDVYALLEKTVDRAEDLANILETLTIKRS